jgi:hypothetical protein
MAEASFSSPSLTTVRQPLQEVGSGAVRVLLQRLAGTEVEPHTIVTAPLVLRRSCGCSESDSPDRRSLPPGIEPQGTQALREGALREIVRRELMASRMQREMGRLGEAILGASDYAELGPLLSQACRLLSVRRLAVTTYSSSQHHARVTLESSGDSVVFQEGAQPFPLEQLFPPGFLRQATPAQIAVQSLELAGEQFGYLVLDGDVRDAHAYLELRRTLSSSLSRMAQSRELRRLYAAEKRRG